MEAPAVGGARYGGKWNNNNNRKKKKKKTILKSRIGDPSLDVNGNQISRIRPLPFSDPAPYAPPSDSKNEPRPEEVRYDLDGLALVKTDPYAGEINSDRYRSARRIGPGN